MTADMASCKYFIFSTSDSEDYKGLRIHADRIAESRLQKYLWPLYANTRNRQRIGAGDKVLIYIGGEGKLRQHIIAIGEVEDCAPVTTTLRSVDSEDVLTAAAEYIVTFSRIERLAPPINFKSLLPQLKMCPKNLSKWGVILMGGTRQIEETDYKMIKSSAEKTRAG